MRVRPLLSPQFLSLSLSHQDGQRWSSSRIAGRQNGDRVFNQFRDPLITLSVGDWSGGQIAGRGRMS